MLLVDKDIKKYVESNQLILSGYKKENLNGISYDLTLNSICGEGGKEYSEYELKPGETVFIKTEEQLSIPNNILGRIAEKNSRMRQGLKVDGPHYQPGHVTYAFLRVQNISSDIIVLQKEMKIAQIIFEQLTREPEVTYAEQPGAAFRDEVHYKGLGNYKEEYEKQTRKEIERAKEDIEGISQKIYANVLTIMGVFVAIFALLSINYQAFTQTEIDFRYIWVMNLTLALCIVIMMGLILIFINKTGSKKVMWIYIGILGLLAIATVVASLAIF
ncbi:MAG: hypothetical protein HFI68_06095 [Lachnospiraceae bacterium]|nr:hypothetical protein [Lachnospiraceae bacterium]